MKLLKLIRSNKGYALLMVMIIVGIAALTAASTMKRTYTVASLNQRSKQFQGSMYAAASAVEKVYARMRYDYVTGGEASVTNNFSTNVYQNLYPTSAENTNWAKYEFSNAQGNVNKTYVQLLVNSSSNYIVLDGTYSGLSAWRGVYRTVSNARPLTGLYGVAAGVRQDIALDKIPCFQYAIFYNSQLEFTYCATLNVRGRTHANGPICPGPQSGGGATLTFWDKVTTTSSIYKSNLAGYFASNMNDATYNSTKIGGQPTLQLPIGTNNSSAAVREIINVPPSGESVTSQMGRERFYNKAAILLLVSNTTVTLTIKDLGAAASTGLSSNWNYTVATNLWTMSRYLPFLSITNSFTDYREASKPVLTTQIDIGKLNTWIYTNRNYTNSILTNKFPINVAPYPNIMYVGDFRTGGTTLYSVRLVNGQVIPTNGPSAALATGFTVATPNPLYIKGHYNCPDSGALGKVDVSKTFPASVISDSITILSGNWDDSTYGTSTRLSSRDAADTTINAAMIAGVVYTTGTTSSTFSGGVVNYTRLLEDWGGRTLTLNSSIVNLYNSVRATNQFVLPGTYYNAPTRNFNFNTNYLIAAKLPPGTPCVSAISRLNWTTTPINSVTYVGP